MHTLLLPTFPIAYREDEFLPWSVSALEGHGFSRDDTIAAVSTCRDELCRGFDSLVEDYWGQQFALGGLAGMVSAGRSGIVDLSRHKPSLEDAGHFVLYGMAHIGLANGAPGSCQRRGRIEDCGACGDLCRLQRDLRRDAAVARPLAESTPRLPDPEANLLRARLVPHITPQHLDDLVSLTELAADAIAHDLEYLVEAVMPMASVAIFSGILVHADGPTFVAPRGSVLRERGRRFRIDG